MTLTQTTEPTLGGQKTKGRKNSTFLEAWEKETSNTITLKNERKKMKILHKKGTN